jgi:carbonic anhydrase
MKLNSGFLVAMAMIINASSVAAEGHGAHWDYKGNGRPSHWGELDKEFETCKLGNEQSPVDIRTNATQKTDLPAITTSYTASSGELVNNGHTIQINLANAGSASVPSGSYKLLQFHFHTPSEEKINGKSFPLVAHLVHKNEAGNLAVIGVLFEEGKENPALKEIFSHLPTQPSKQPLKNEFNASDLLPKNMGYYAYKGSLTTPPCSEGVAWQVLKTPVELSKGQIQAFQKVFRMNARPVQPLNQRKILESN